MSSASALAAAGARRATSTRMHPFMRPAYRSRELVKNCGDQAALHTPIQGSADHVDTTPCMAAGAGQQPDGAVPAAAAAAGASCLA